MMRRVAVAILWLLCLPASSNAQAKDDFVRGVIDLSQAVSGSTGADAAAVRSSLDAMAKGLAEWDAAISRVEAGFTGAIGGAPPAAAARMRTTIAAAYLERGRTAEAVVHLDRAVTLDPAFLPAHLLRGLAHQRLNQVPAAVSAFEAARRLDAAAAAPAYLYLQATRGGPAAPDRTAALDALLTAVSAGPTQTDLAVLPPALLDDASVDSPLFVPAAYVPGLRLLAEAKYSEAIASLRAAVAADTSTDEQARLARADALQASKQYAAAHASLTDTTRRFPLSGQAQWRLGRLSEDGADPAGALNAYEAAARLVPVAGASLVHAAIGRLQHAALNLGPAARAYERRVALVPQSAQAHLELAAVYQAQDRLDDALVEDLAAAIVDPANASAYAAAGQLRADMGDDAGAIALLRAAVRLDAKQGAARYALGRALLRAGRADEAREQLTAFEAIQKAEMETQRRQFEENSRALESALSGAKGGQ
jgi:tetratricopeptide (TPR) repeat protein